jgi:hypothetical protein
MPGRNAFVWVIASLSSSACVSSPPLQEPEPRTMIVEAEDARSVNPAAPARREVPYVETSTPTTSTTGTGTGIPECEEYLALYERCEHHLEPQIMAGDRRFAHAERAWYEHLAGSPEAASLPSACQDLLDALQVDCPEQHRAPERGG